MAYTARAQPCVKLAVTVLLLSTTAVTPTSVRPPTPSSQNQLEPSAAEYGSKAQLAASEGAPRKRASKRRCVGSPAAACPLPPATVSVVLVAPTARLRFVRTNWPC